MVSHLSGLAGTQTGECGPGLNRYDGAVRLRLEKSSSSAILFAIAERLVNGSSLQRHSMKRSTDVWSNGVLATAPRRANGETRIAGTRNPSRPSTLPASSSLFDV